MSDRLPLEFWRGVEEFNHQAFYECHDTLEALWMEALDPEKRFYQGVLQIAVGCYHLSNHNWRGAVMLLGEGIRRLVDYTPAEYGVDVTKLVEQSNLLLKALQSSGIEKVESFSYLFNPASESSTTNSKNSTDAALINPESMVILPHISTVEG